MADKLSKEALDELKDRVGRSRNIAQQQHATWKALYDYYEGPGQKAAFDFSKQASWIKDECRVANFVYSTVRTTVPILLDSAPMPYVVDERGALQDKVSDYLHAFYHRRGIRSELRMALEDSQILGTGALKVRFDAQGPDGGDATITWQDPFCIFPDTTADRLDNCEFVALLNEYSKEQAKEIFSGTKTSAYEKINLETAAKSEWTGATRPGKDRTSTETEELIEVWEVYHEFGRRMTIYTGDQVLYSGANPLGENWPIVFFTPEPNPRNIWGPSAIAQLKTVQDDINLLRLRGNINMRLTANPQKVMWGKPNTEPTNKPGEIYRFNGMKQEEGIEHLMPTTLPADFWNLMTMNREAFDVISGVHNVTRGKRPVGIQAGVAIEALQQAGLTRPREVIREVAISLERLWQLTLECMQVNYNEPRSLGYMTQEGVKLGQVGPDQLSEAASGDDLGLVDRAKRFFRVGEETRSPKNLRILVQTGGDVPMNQAQRSEQAIRLWQTEAIDRAAVLEETNFPNRHQVVERMDAKEQAMMQAQMQQQMMGMQGQQQGMAEEDMGEPTMTPEQAMHILQQALEPEELVALVEIRESLVAQRPLDEEQEELLQRLSRNPQLAEAIEAYLLAPYEPEEEEGGGSPGPAPREEPLTNPEEVF